MSIDAISWAWKQEVDGPTQMVVLLHLADSANDLDGHTYYSLAKIANRCRCHRTTVIRQLQALVKTGYITLVREAVNGRSGNVYKVNHQMPKEERIALAQSRLNEPDTDCSITDNSQTTAKVVAESDQTSSTVLPEVVAESDHTDGLTSSVERRGVAESDHGGSTALPTSSTERPVVVAESDTNLNLLTQNKPLLTSPPVDNSATAERPSDPQASPVDARMRAVFDVLEARGCKPERLDLPDTRMLVRAWLANTLTVGKLEAAMLAALPDDDAVEDCADPIRKINAKLYPVLTGKRFDDAEEAQLRLRSTPKGANAEDRRKCMEAAGLAKATRQPSPTPEAQMA